MAENPVIALLTDFGTDDIYVGVMQAVMHAICPQARFIDISHAIQPQNVRQGAFALLNAYRYFTDGTVFLVVIDPGVGTARRPTAVRADAYTFVAPDNGILTYVLADLSDVQLVELANPDYQLAQPSNTFHGRDIFAPAAAHLAAGVPLEQFGPKLEQLFTLPAPTLTVVEQRVIGEVMHVDRFGNIVTSIGHLRWVTPERLTLTPRFGDRERTVPVLAHDAVVTIHGLSINTVSHAYGETERGYLLALVGSDGHLEIAINQGNAASRLDVKIGDRVELEIGDVHAAIRN
jgi:S-adenosyl-L-methionine hydrolase (adenosine-forming)